AFAHQVVTRRELERPARERQEPQLRGVEPAEERYPAQHLRFLEYIHPILRAVAQQNTTTTVPRKGRPPEGAPSPAILGCGPPAPFVRPRSSVRCGRRRSTNQPGPVMMDKDEFYRDILEGMAVYTRSAFHRDVLTTLARHDEPALSQALNKNQIASKMWLADALADATDPDLGRVLIPGGWFGGLGAVLLPGPRFPIARVTSLDIDPRCADIAHALNATHVQAGKFVAVSADMLDYDYGGGGRSVPAADLVVNTSCEHVRDLGRWYERIPVGQLLALQS